MQTCFQAIRSHPPLAGARGYLRILLLYEDLATAMRVKRALARVSASLLPTVTTELCMWKTEHLGFPLLREIATVDATTANVILVSIHGDNDLPESVQHWLDEWPERPTPAPAVLAVWLDADKAWVAEALGKLSCLQRNADRLALEWIPDLARFAYRGLPQEAPVDETGAATPRAFSLWLAEYADGAIEEG